MSRRQQGSEAIWLVGSQGLSSLGNVLLAIFVARAEDVAGFAAFALAMPVYVIMQRFNRVYLLIPRQIALSKHPKSHISRPPTSAVAVFALTAGVMCVLVGFAIGGEFGMWAGSLGFLLPGLLSYDSSRNEFIALRRMKSAALLDGGWLAGQLMLSALVSVLGGPSLAYLFAWGLPPLIVSCALSFWGHPGQWSILGGLRDLWQFRGRLADGFSDLITSVLVIQAIPYMVLALASVEAAAALRAGQILLGPVNVVVLGTLPLLQMAVARHASARQRVRNFLATHSAVLAVVSGMYGGMLLALPDQMGEQILGDTWQYAQVMLPGLTAHLVLRVPFMGAITTLRSLELTSLVVRQRLAGAALLVSGAVAGCLLPSMTAIAWGMATGGAVAAVWAWLAIWRGRWGQEEDLVEGS